jgi:hypothetical protein
VLWAVAILQCSLVRLAHALLHYSAPEFCTPCPATSVSVVAAVQVTTLLSKEQENRQQQSSSSVSPEQLKSLQEQVTAQGGRVKESKAVSM